MKFYVPIYILIDVQNNNAAIAAKQSIEKLLSGSMVSIAIHSNIPHESITVADPLPAQVTPQGSYNQARTKK